MYKTIEQIHHEYDGQWVFLINCTEGEHNSVAGGEVVLQVNEGIKSFEK